MRTPALLSAAALVLLVLPAQAQAKAQPQPRQAPVPALAADTVLTGTLTGKIRVRLPRAASFDVPTPSRPGSFQASGDGRLIGFALVAAGESPDRVVISGGRTGHQKDVTAVAITHTDALPLGADRWTLPAGEYDLYLVTDGNPAQVRLRLPGLAGATRLAPSTPVAASIERPAPRFLPQGQQTGGATGTLGGPGLLLSVATTVHPFSHAQLFQQCVYAPDRARTALHAPGCPDATTASGPLMTNPNSERTLVQHVGGTLTSSGGPFAQGYSLTNAGLNDRVEYTSLWLTF
jgi:hypothetical protein